MKTAFDSMMYAVGASDEVEGTGVWSHFKLKREDDEKKAEEEEQ